MRSMVDKLEARHACMAFEIAYVVAKRMLSGQVSVMSALGRYGHMT